MHTCNALAHTNVDIELMITHGCVEGHGIIIINYLQHAKYINVLDAVWKARGHHRRMAQQGELEVDGILFVLVISMEVESGEVEILL